MLNPALAIFSTVASCKLPFGKPNRSIFFSLLFILKIVFCAGSQIFFLRFLHTRNRIDLPLLARQRQFFLLRFFHLISSTPSAVRAPTLLPAPTPPRNADTIPAPPVEFSRATFPPCPPAPPAPSAAQ